MAVHYSVHQKCRPKLTLGNGSMERGASVIRQTLKAIAHCDRLEEEVEEQGGSVDDIRIPYVELTNESPTERELTFEDVQLKRYKLDDGAAVCEACPANFTGEPYGCFGRLSTPIAETAERWLLDRLQPRRTFGGRLLHQALRDLGYDGTPIAARRAGGLFEAKRAPARLVSGGLGLPTRVSADRIWHALLAVGRLDPNHCLGLLLWLGALKIGGTIVGSAEHLGMILACRSPEERAELAELDLSNSVGSEDLRGVDALLTAAYVAWLNGVPLTIDS